MTPGPVSWSAMAIVAIAALGQQALSRSAPVIRLPLFEGDILGYTPRPDGALANAITDRSRLWPDSIVPYEISDAFSSTQKDIITRAMRAMQEKTCIRFRRKQPGDTHSVIIDSFQSRECFAFWGRKTHDDIRNINSQIGYTGFQQLVNIGIDGCLTHGVVQHELLHTIGFLHEQSRKDRDSYVEILWDNIDPVDHSQFGNRDETNAQGQPYDFESLMHYGRKDFSNNGQDTIRPKAAYESRAIGNRRGMSEIDIKKVNLLYQCPATDPDDGEEPVTFEPPVVRTTSSPTGENCEYRFMCVLGNCGNFRVCTIGGEVETTTQSSYHCHQLAQCNGLYCTTSYVCH